MVLLTKETNNNTMELININKSEMTEFARKHVKDDEYDIFSKSEEYCVRLDNAEIVLSITTEDITNEGFTLETKHYININEETIRIDSIDSDFCQVVPVIIDYTDNQIIIPWSGYEKTSDEIYAYAPYKCMTVTKKGIYCNSIC